MIYSLNRIGPYLLVELAKIDIGSSIIIKRLIWKLKECFIRVTDECKRVQIGKLMYEYVRLNYFCKGETRILLCVGNM